jgi:hypothetical protein
MKVKSNIAISDTGFVFDPGTGESYTFNQTGLEIFKMLKEGKDFDGISSLIISKYDLDKLVFEKFYYDFISMLKQYQLLEDV